MILSQKNKNMCYTRVVTKEKGNCSVTDKRYNIYKEDIKMAVVKLTTDNFEQEVIQALQPEQKLLLILQQAMVKYLPWYGGL